MTVSGGSGSGNGSFTLVWPRANGGAARSVVITVSGGNLSQTITINQSGTTGPPPTTGDCFVITNKQTNQYLQAQPANTVEQMVMASSQANQVWKL